MIKHVVTALKMTPVNETVSIPLVHQESGFVPNELLIRAAKAMFDEPLRAGKALRPFRTVETR